MFCLRENRAKNPLNGCLSHHKKLIYFVVFLCIHSTEKKTNSLMQDIAKKRKKKLNEIK